MADFLSGPKTFTFPLWQGQDITFNVKRKDSEGVEIPYDAETFAKIIFNAGTVNEIEFEAVIDGSNAQFIIDDTEVADVKTGSKWRLQFTVDGQDKTPVLGKVSRKDA